MNINITSIYDEDVLITGSAEVGVNFRYRVYTSHSKLILPISSMHFSYENVNITIPYSLLYIGENGLNVEILTEYDDSTVIKSFYFSVTRFITKLTKPDLVRPTVVEVGWKPILFPYLELVGNLVLRKSTVESFSTYIDINVTGLSYIDSNITQGTYFYKLLVNINLPSNNGSFWNFGSSTGWRLEEGSYFTFDNGMMKLPYTASENVNITYGTTSVDPNYSETNNIKLTRSGNGADYGPFKINNGTILGFSSVGGDKAPATIYGHSSSSLNGGTMYTHYLSRNLTSISVTGVPPTFTEVTEIGDIRYYIKKGDNYYSYDNNTWTLRNLVDIPYDGNIISELEAITESQWLELNDMEPLGLPQDIYVRAFQRNNCASRFSFIDSISFATLPSNRYYAFTENLQLDTSKWFEITGVSVIQNMPAGTTIRYAFSFDNKVTWKVCHSGVWLDTTLSTENLLFNGMVEYEVETSLWNVTSTLDVAVVMSTSLNLTPNVDQITFTYITFNNQYNSETITIPCPPPGYLNALIAGNYITVKDNYSTSNGKTLYGIATEFTVQRFFDYFKAKYDTSLLVTEAGNKDAPIEFYVRNYLSENINTKFYIVNEFMNNHINTVFNVISRENFKDVLTEFNVRGMMSIEPLTYFNIAKHVDVVTNFRVTSRVMFPTIFKVGIPVAKNINTSFTIISKEHINTQFKIVYTRRTKDATIDFEVISVGAYVFLI